MKKYYWYVALCVWHSGQDGDYEEEVLNDKHPFEWIAEVKAWSTGAPYAFTLLNWREISAEEYFMFKNLNN